MLITAFFKRHTVSLLLVCIFVIALFLRFYKLDSIPKGALVDEASYGYIAYSLLNTGKDERGVSTPLHFKAFGDEKLPAYAYILVPIVKVFGLNNFSTRLPSALAGSLLVLVMFAILRTLNQTREASLMGALVVALSPWSVVLSRFAFESNLALLFFGIGLWSMFASLRSKQSYHLILTAIFFSLTWYTYVPYRFITTMLFAICLILVYLQKQISIQKILGLLVIAIILVVPLIPHTLSKSGTTRLNQVGVFSDSGIPFAINDRRSYCDMALPSIVCRILENKPLSLTSKVISNQLRAFSPEFLFLDGEKDILYLSVPEYGVFPIILIVFYILGGVVLLRKLKGGQKHLAFILIAFSLYIASLPSALVGPPQRVRLSGLLPFMIIIFALGYDLVIRYILKSKMRLAIHTLVGIAIVALGTMYVVELYFVHIPKLKLDYGSEIPGVMQYIYANHDQKDVFFEKFDDNFPIFYAYFNSINPDDYHRSALYSPIDSGGFSHPIAYKNLKKPDEPITALICDKNRESFYYVTNEALKDMGVGEEKPVYTELSGDKRSIVTYVYYINPARYQKICSVR